MAKLWFQVRLAAKGWFHCLPLWPFLTVRGQSLEGVRRQRYASIAAKLWFKSQKIAQVL
jgi:hypothetical protein